MRLYHSIRAARMVARLSLVALAGCSIVQKADAARDTAARDSAARRVAVVAPAAARDSVVLPLTADTTATPLSRDTVTFPADTGLRLGADGRPVFPLIFARSCEGEDCETSFPAFACAPVDLRASPFPTAPVVARVARGDTVQVSRADLHVVQPGIVVVKARTVIDSEFPGDGDPRPRPDTLRLAAGDTLWLIRYESLGEWDYWWRGRMSSGSEFWGVPPTGEAFGESSADSSRAIARSQPVTESWWLLSSGARPLGWWRVDSLARLRSLRTMDYWGDYCPGQPHPHPAPR